MGYDFGSGADTDLYNPDGTLNKNSPAYDPRLEPGAGPGGTSLPGYSGPWAKGGVQLDPTGRWRLGAEYGAPVNGYDLLYNDDGSVRARDELSDAQRLGLGAQGALQGGTSWADMVAGRKAPTMSAAVLGAYTPMGYANAGSGAMGSAASLDPSQMNESRAMQMGLAGSLWDQAQGKGPSLAGAQLKAGNDQMLANQMSAAASQRGTSNTSMGARQFAMQGAQGSQQLAQQSAMARMQEINDARSQYGTLSSAIRGQDYATANANAGYGQQMALSNQQSANQFALANAGFRQQAYGADAQNANQYGLQQGQFNQQANANNLQAYLQNQQAGDQAKQWAYGNQIGAWNSAADRDANTNTANANRSQQQSQFDTAERDKWLATAGTALTYGAVAASDERGKTDVRDGAKTLREFFGSIGAHAYRYKDGSAPFAGAGEYVSPMAQELAKTELGKHMVMDTGRGLAVDYGKGFGTLFAGVADSTKRLDSLEETLGLSKKKAA